jgi:hypothetical protein
LLGIDFQPAHPGSPAEKPHIEKMMSTVGTLFCQYVSGYLGSSVERRGRGVEAEPLWSMLELQELLDEWLVAGWQNRRHDGLRDPVSPGRTFTPNEKYASLVQAAGYIAVALSADDYIELLPASWRAINHYGVKIGRRTYDSNELNPLRRQPSGVRDKKNLWEVHRDPLSRGRDNGSYADLGVILMFASSGRSESLKVGITRAPLSGVPACAQVFAG